MMAGSVLCFALYCFAFMNTVFAAVPKPAGEDGTALLQIVFSEKATAQHANIMHDTMHRSAGNIPASSAETNYEAAGQEVVGSKAEVKDETEGVYASAYGALGEANVADKGAVDNGQSGVYPENGVSYDSVSEVYPSPLYPGTGVSKGAGGDHAPAYGAPDGANTVDKAAVGNGQSGVYYPEGGVTYDPQPGAYTSPPYTGTVGGEMAAATTASTPVHTAPSSTPPDKIDGTANEDPSRTLKPAGSQKPAEYDVGSGAGKYNDEDEYYGDYSETVYDYDGDSNEGKSARLQQPGVYEEKRYTNDKYSKGDEYGYARDIGQSGGGQYTRGYLDKYGTHHDFSHTTTKDRRHTSHHKGQCDHREHSGKCGGYHSTNEYEDYHYGTMRKYAHPQSQDYQHAEYHRAGGIYGGNRKAYYDKERRSQYHEYHKEGKRDYKQYGKPLDHVYAKHGDCYYGKSQEEKHHRNGYDSLGGTFHSHAHPKKMGDKYADYHGAGPHLDASNKQDYRGDHSSKYKRSGTAWIQSGSTKPWRHMTVKEEHRCTKLIKVYKKEIVNKCSEIKTNFTVAKWTWGKIKHLPATKTKSTCMKLPAWKKANRCIKFVKMRKACKKVPRVKVSHTCMKRFRVYKKEVKPKCHEKIKHFTVPKHIFGKLKRVHVRKFEKVCVHVPVKKKEHKCVKWSKKLKTEFVEQCVEKGMGKRHYARGR